MHAVVQVNPYFLQYRDQADKKIQNGFQLYLQTRVGYTFNFSGDRWFLKPSIGINYFPITTNTPAGFEAIEDGFSPYNLFDVNLFFGYRF